MSFARFVLLYLLWWPCARVRRTACNLAQVVWMIQNVNPGHDVFCDDATRHFHNGKRVILKGEGLESHVLSQSDIRQVRGEPAYCCAPAWLLTFRSSHSVRTDDSANVCVPVYFFSNVGPFWKALVTSVLIVQDQLFDFAVFPLYTRNP